MKEVMIILIKRKKLDKVSVDDILKEINKYTIRRGSILFELESISTNSMGIRG